MALSEKASSVLGVALADIQATNEIVTILNASAAGQAIAPSAAVVPPAITYTATASTYVADGTLTIAAGATPTVVELLNYCQELQRSITQLQAVLHAHGLTT